MKKYMVAAVSFLVGAYGFAQTLEGAIQKTDNELYEQANGDFKALIAKEPAKADNYFYYGENLLLQEGPEAAYPMWQKAADMAPATPISLVAKGKLLWYKGDTAAARQQFILAAGEKKNKNPEAMRQIGAIYTYAPVKNLNGAITILNEAVKLEPKNIDGYLILGDALLEKTPANGSPAIEKYNYVLYNIDAKSARAIVRKARLYERTRAYKEANDLYTEAQTADPTYAPAFSANAELNMQFDQYKRAIENWEKYLQLNNSTEARYRYASSLFSAKKYCEAIKELETIRSQGFENFYTHRMMAYSLYECTEGGDAKRGLEESDKFFSMVPQDKVIALDYKYRGRLYSKSGSDSLAILEYEKAVAKDTSRAVRADLLSEIGKLHMKSKHYDEAIAAYEAKKAYENLNAAEQFELGRAYYFGPKNYALADSAFRALNEQSPDYATGYYWRAKSAYKLDAGNTNWAAKPFYEKYLTSITEEEKGASYHKAPQIEAAKYLGDYYVNSKEGKDLAQAKLYWNQVLALDPNDAQAKKVLATLK